MNSAPKTYIFRIDSTYSTVWGKSSTALEGGGGLLATDSAETKVYMASKTASNHVVIELDAVTGGYSTGYEMTTGDDTSFGRIYVTNGDADLLFSYAVGFNNRQICKAVISSGATTCYKFTGDNGFGQFGVDGGTNFAAIWMVGDDGFYIQSYNYDTSTENWVKKIACSATCNSGAGSIDYSNDGSKAYLMLSMNHDSVSALMIFILDSSNGGVIGDSFFTNSTGGMLLNNYEVDNFLYSVKG